MARQRLLEGFLLRLAAGRDADAFALRGGMLVHHWLPEARRYVRDIDLVCTLPYRPRDVCSRLLEILRRDAGDGVVFGERIRIDRTSYAGRPGLRMFAAGRADGSFAEITVDLAFIEAWPTSTRGRLATEHGAAAVWTCAHEMVVATKLAVIAELGPRAWRTKDLADIWIGLRRFTPTAALGEAFERRLGSAHAADEVLAAPWWRDTRAEMRWSRNVSRRAQVPAALDAVLAEIRDTLAPFARTP